MKLWDTSDLGGCSASLSLSLVNSAVWKPPAQANSVQLIEQKKHDGRTKSVAHSALSAGRLQLLCRVYRA